MPRIVYDLIEYDYDAELSLRDFTGWDFNAHEGFDFNNKVIYASCFSHEKPDHGSFPESMQGATFIKCNLDNVFVPEGNTIIDCSQRRFACQPDGTDWLIDDQGNPLEPL